MDDPKAHSIHEIPAEDAELEARLDAEAMAAYRAGRVVPHAKVVDWLESWGTGNPLPRPKSEPR